MIILCIILFVIAIILLIVGLISTLLEPKRRPKMNKWYLRLKDGGLIEIKDAYIINNTGSFNAFAGLDKITSLICNNIEHNIEVTCAEPVVEGWAKYSFIFIDYDSVKIKAYNDFIDQLLSPNNHRINVIKYLDKLLQLK